jgi:hypothetical protein
MASEEEEKGVFDPEIKQLETLSNELKPDSDKLFNEASDEIASTGTLAERGKIAIQRSEEAIASVIPGLIRIGYLYSNQPRNVYKPTKDFYFIFVSEADQTIVETNRTLNPQTKYAKALFTELNKFLLAKGKESRYQLGTEEKPYPISAEQFFNINILAKVAVAINKIDSITSKVGLIPKEDMDFFKGSEKVLVDYIPEKKKGSDSFFRYRFVDRKQYDNVIKKLWGKISELYNQLPKTGNQIGTPLFKIIQELLKMLLGIMSIWDKTRLKKQRARVASEEDEDGDEQNNYLTYTTEREANVPLISGEPTWETVTNSIMGPVDKTKPEDNYNGLRTKISTERSNIKYQGNPVGQYFSRLGKGVGGRKTKRRNPRKSKGRTKHRRTRKEKRARK